MAGAQPAGGQWAARGCPAHQPSHLACFSGVTFFGAQFSRAVNQQHNPGLRSCILPPSRKVNLNLHPQPCSPSPRLPATGHPPGVPPETHPVHSMQPPPTRSHAYSLLLKYTTTSTSYRWQDQVTVVPADMREWDAPEQADILVSELLGSFGDNELSPGESVKAAVLPEATPDAQLQWLGPLHGDESCLSCCNTTGAASGVWMAGAACSAGRSCWSSGSGDH